MNTNSQWQQRSINIMPASWSLHPRSLFLYSVYWVSEGEKHQLKMEYQRGQQQNKHCTAVTQKRISSSLDTHTPLTDHSAFWTILKTCSREQNANPVEITCSNDFFTCPRWLNLNGSQSTMTNRDDTELCKSEYGLSLTSVALKYSPKQCPA